MVPGSPEDERVAGASVGGAATTGAGWAGADRTTAGGGVNVAGVVGVGEAPAIATGAAGSEVPHAAAPTNTRDASALIVRMAMVNADAAPMY
jgi:hypothetical protein